MSVGTILSLVLNITLLIYITLQNKKYTGRWIAK